jgi:coenzyme F420-reducing hydrogenase alpha subunit
MMLKIVDVCTRIEGHGNVKIILQDDNISTVDFEINTLRGFEQILIGKRLIELPRIVSRICGLCHASQSIVSCKAIEHIFNVEPDEQMILLRKLLLTGELIKSHSMHYFFQALPDLLHIFGHFKNVPNPYELTHFDPQLTSYMYELVKFGNEIDKIFGGRSVHLINTIPGGVIYTPIKKDFTTVKRYFQKVIVSIDYVLDKFINLFSNFEPPEQFTLPNTTFLSQHFHGNYGRYNGILRLLTDQSKPVDFQFNNYERYFDKDPDLRGINFNLEKDSSILVGPLARYNLIESYNVEDVDKYFTNFDKSWKRSTLFMNFLRLIEIFVEANQALAILDNPALKGKRNLSNLKKIERKDGVGILEAPRGTLIHHYKIDENKIVKEVKLLIATEINIPLINTMITNYARRLYQKTGDINGVKCDVQQIIRSFDPCVSCASH